MEERRFSDARHHMGRRVQLPYNSPTNITHKSMKAYKSLKSYNFYICVHVEDAYYNLVDEKNEFCFNKSEVDWRIMDKSKVHKSSL